MKTLKRIALYCYLGVFLLVVLVPLLGRFPPDSEAAKAVLKMSGALRSLFYLMSIGVGIWLYRWLFAKAPPTTHGSARLGTAEDAQAGGNLDPRPGGLALGRVTGELQGDRRYRIHGKHILTCAPTGAGKGVGCVIPNVLEYPGSVFVLDLKGETFAVTARRRRELGQRVHVIDPFKITAAEQRSAVNWLDWIDPSAEEAVSEAASLVDTLVLRSEKGERYWDDAAVSLLQGLLLHIATLPAEERHVGTLRAILTKPAKILDALLELISEDEKVAWGLPARAASMFLAKADKERSGVLSTAQQHTSFLDDPRVVATLQRSDVDFRTLKTEPQTVYLVIPPDKLSAYSRYARAKKELANDYAREVSGERSAEGGRGDHGGDEGAHREPGVVPGRDGAGARAADERAGEGLRGTGERAGEAGRAAAPPLEQARGELGAAREHPGPSPEPGRAGAPVGREHEGDRADREGAGRADRQEAGVDQAREAGSDAARGAGARAAGGVALGAGLAEGDRARAGEGLERERSELPRGGGDGHVRTSEPAREGAAGETAERGADARRAGAPEEAREAPREVSLAEALEDRLLAAELERRFAQERARGPSPLERYAAELRERQAKAQEQGQERTQPEKSKEQPEKKQEQAQPKKKQDKEQDKAHKGRQRVIERDDGDRER
jgi:hypothetical protein